MSFIRKIGRHQEGHFIVLFALTLAFHIALPVFRGFRWLDIIAGLGFVATLGYAGWLTLERRHLRLAYLGLMVVSIVSTAMLVTTDHVASRGNWLVYHAILVSLSASLVIRWTVQQRRVTLDTIFAALSGYYLLGFTWALIYAFIDMVLPSAFNVTLSAGIGMDQAFYFSFVTLTTLGFGDITPTHPISRSLATTEALIGQIYLVVLVARLVAMRTDDAPDHPQPNE